MKSTPHELARAAVDEAVTRGQVAHHSGASDALYRSVVARVRRLTDTGDSTSWVDAGLQRGWDGTYRVVIENELGTWDSVIPVVDAERIAARG